MLLTERDRETMMGGMKEAREQKERIGNGVRDKGLFERKNKTFTKAAKAVEKNKAEGRSRKTITLKMVISIMKTRFTSKKNK